MFRHSTRPLGALVGIALTVLFATGCAAGAAPQGQDAAPVPDDQIASLETAAPEKTATEDPLIAEYGEPVRLRLDMTDEESEAAWQPRERCLADRMPKATITGGQDSGVGVATNDDPVAAAEAEAFCMKFAPLPPHELDAQTPTRCGSRRRWSTACTPLASVTSRSPPPTSSDRSPSLSAVSRTTRRRSRSAW